MRNLGIGSWIARRAAMGPERVAVVFEDHPITYGELNERVLRLAHALAALGVRRGDRVGYLGLNHSASIETLFAAGILGATYVALNVRFSLEDNAYCIDDAGARVLVFGAEQSSLVDKLRKMVDVRDYICIGRPRQPLPAYDYEELVASHPSKMLDEQVSLDEIAVLAYTSGTTGLPKGVPLTHGNITWTVFNVMAAMDFRTDEVHVFPMPMRALATALMPTIYKGGTVVLLRGFDPGVVLDTVERYRATSLFITPEMLNALLHSPRMTQVDYSSLRFCIGAGSVFSEEQLRACIERGFPVVQAYGLTETSLALCLDQRDSLDKIGSTGRQQFFTEVRVVDRDLRDVPPGTVGEVLIRGPNVTRGYWNRLDATREAITEDAWLRTGDAAWRDESNCVFIVGRVREALEFGGQTVYPPEIEGILRLHPAVADCGVLPVKNGAGVDPAACVVLRQGNAASEADLIEFCTSRLPEHKRPRKIRFVDLIPRNANEKILRAKLPGVFEASPATAPRGNGRA